MTSTCIRPGSQTGIWHPHPPQPILRPSRALKRPLKRSKSRPDARKCHSQVSHAPQACWRASRLGSRRLSQPQFNAFSRNLDCPRHSSAATATYDATGDATYGRRYPSIVVDLSPQSAGAALSHLACVAVRREHDQVHATNIQQGQEPHHHRCADAALPHTANCSSCCPGIRPVPPVRHA
jgi:hypothetical protein